MQQLSYRRHRFPPLIIQHAVWLYLRFTLSYRDVEELLAERGIDVSNEAIRRWVLKFGRHYAQPTSRPYSSWRRSWRLRRRGHIGDRQKMAGTEVSSAVLVRLPHELGLPNLGRL